MASETNILEISEEMIPLETNSTALFNETMTRLLNDGNVLKMQQFGQHHGNNTLQHCINVARYSFYLAQTWNWKIDEVSLATGAMLHDYYLYCTKDMTISAFRHGVGHPKTAYTNASKVWELNTKEKNIILSHMWPLTPFSFPHSKEAFLVTVADKYCAVREFSASRDEKAIDPYEHTAWMASFIKRTLKGMPA